MEPPRGPTVFVHAMGRGGSNAWPKQVGVDFGRKAEFIARRGWDDQELPEAYTFEGEAEWLASQLAMPTHIVGQSWSGVVALELALRRHDLVSSLLLCEPALLRVAADHRCVQEHLALMKPAYEPGLTVEEFGFRFSAGWGTEDDPSSWTEERRYDRQRLMRHEPPWNSTIGLEQLRSLGVPTLVLTSGAIEMFEVVAQRISAVGDIAWMAIGGPDHRPQDGEAFNRIAANWWNSVESGGA